MSAEKKPTVYVVSSWAADDPCYDQDNDKKSWMEQYFGEYQSPSSRGGYEELMDPPGYYNSRSDEPGFRTCNSCGASVYGHGFYDIDHLTVHRAFHDQLGF